MGEEKSSIYKKLINIQSELKVPKGQFNKFGNYKFRNCEDILEAVKPLCKKNNAVVIVNDEIQQIGERFYVKATVTFIDIESGENIQNTAYAREENEKKGMDGSQLTGTASSYARKYALNGLFCIDDTKDADTTTVEEHEEQEKVISEKLANGLNKAIENSNMSQEVIDLILNGYGYTNIAEIKSKDYMKIVNEFRAKK